MPFVPTGNQDPVGHGADRFFPEALVSTALLSLGNGPWSRAVLSGIIITRNDRDAGNPLGTGKLHPFRVSGMSPGPHFVHRFAGDAAGWVVGVDSIEDLRCTLRDLIADEKRATRKGFIGFGNDVEPAIDFDFTYRPAIHEEHRFAVDLQTG